MLEMKDYVVENVIKASRCKCVWSSQKFVKFVCKAKVKEDTPMYIQQENEEDGDELKI